MNLIYPRLLGGINSLTAPSIAIMSILCENAVSADRGNSSAYPKIACMSVYWFIVVSKRIQLVLTEGDKVLS